MIGKVVGLIQVPNQRLFNIREAAQYLGISVDTLRAYTEEGRLVALRLGRRRVYSLEELNRFIEDLPPYEIESTLRPGGEPGGKELTNGS